MNEEIVRFMILLESVFQQGAMLKFDIRQNLKRRFNNFDAQIQSLLDLLRKEIKDSPEAEEYLEFMTVMYMETLRQVEACKDPKAALAIITALNEGAEISVDGVKIKDYTVQRNKAA